MTRESAEKYTWPNNVHNQWVADCFARLCAKSLPSSEHPKLFYCSEDDTWYFENFTSLSARVFFKVVRDSLERVPNRKSKFNKPVSTLNISDIDALIKREFECQWSVFIVPGSSDWTFFFDDDDEAVTAAFSI